MKPVSKMKNPEYCPECREPGKRVYTVNSVIMKDPVGQEKIIDKSNNFKHGQRVNPI